MPGVEELEPEPRNVPQRPLKRQAKRGGRVRGKRRARDSDVSCTAQSLAMFISGEEDGGSISSLSALSTVSIYLPPRTHPPTHSSSGTLAAIRLGVRKTSLLPACCFSVSHSLSCECPDLWPNRKRCARVIARLRSRWRRGASIRRLPDVTDIYNHPPKNPKNFDSLGAVGEKKKTLKQTMCSNTWDWKHFSGLLHVFGLRS